MGKPISLAWSCLPGNLVSARCLLSRHKKAQVLGWCADQ